MNNIQIVVGLPKNRDKTGKLSLQINYRTIKTYSVLGRGSRGNGETSLQIEGNTPTGKYISTKIEDTSKWKRDSYGRYGAIRLTPMKGNALLAKWNGRKGILIHGGGLRNGELKPTLGCLRLHNEDIRDLINQIIKVSIKNNKIQPSIYIKIFVIEY